MQSMESLEETPSEQPWHVITGMLDCGDGRGLEARMALETMSEALGVAVSRCFDAINGGHTSEPPRHVVTGMVDCGDGRGLEARIPLNTVDVSVVVVQDAINGGRPSGLWRHVVTGIVESCDDG